jgi:hypothetical protein
MAHRDAAQRHFGRRSVDVRRFFDLVWYDVALRAGYGATVFAAGKVHLVGADTERVDRAIAERVLRRRGVVGAAVARLAFGRDVVDDAVDMALGMDEAPLGVDDLAVASEAAIGGGVRRWRRQAMAGAARLCLGLGPERPRVAVAVAVAAAAHRGVVAGRTVVRARELAEH